MKPDHGPIHERIATTEGWLRRLRMAEVLDGVVLQGHAASLVPPPDEHSEALMRARSEAFEQGRIAGIRDASAALRAKNGG